MMIVMMIVMITSVVIGARAGATYLFQFQILLSFPSPSQLDTDLQVELLRTGAPNAVFFLSFIIVLDGSGLDRDCIVFARK